jgi:putative nucleotidyltransferase with HDIG domain
MGQAAQHVVGRANATSIYVAIVATTAFATAAALIAAGDRIDAPITVLALSVAAAVAERSGMRITGHVELSVSGIPALFAAVLFGPLAAGVVGAASMLGDPELMSRDRSRAPRLKWASYTSTRFIVGALTGIAAQAMIAIVPSDFGGLVVATLVATLLRELLDIAFSTLTAAVRGASPLETARSLTPLLLVAPPIYAPLVALLAFMYVDVSPWTLILFLPPAIAAQKLYALYRQERQLAADLSVVNEILERANLQFASALIATLDARDRYTAGHSAAVAIYTRDIAQRMSLPPETCDLAYLCGLVHDIGKIGLPPGLLEKPGALTLEERRQMQEHSAIGERILAHVDEYSEIARIVRHHHERMDGQGYPDGLVDEDIPLVSRIIAVADAYNAMTSDRPYRDAMPSRVARLRLAQAVDSQFDTAAVAAFEAILAGADEDYRVARRRDFLVVPTSYEEGAPSAEVGPPIAEVA